MKRIQSIDFVRGLVMVIMALDHVRDLIMVTTSPDPVDLANTTPTLFMTRWMTHLCAPTFVFLSGTSAFLSLKNKSDINASRRFLLTRGLWLVFLNFTIVNFGIFFDIHFSVLFSQVIAAIGVGFMGLALLLPFSTRTMGILGLITIFGHDLFQGVSFPQGSPTDVVWSLLMGVGFYPVTPHFTFFTTYAYIPWLGIMLAGYACGDLFLLPSEKRKKLFLKIAIAALTLFALVRTFNMYGDSSHWSFQKNGVFSLLSFINTSKYPPSLLYTLMTLGIMFLLLYAFDVVQNKLTDIISIYGKVPLFYYLIHWFVIHVFTIIIFFAQGYHWSDLQFGGFSFGRPKEGGGFALFGTYVLWLCVVVSLYPLCHWYSKYKMQHKEKTWLRYL